MIQQGNQSNPLLESQSNLRLKLTLPGRRAQNQVRPHQYVFTIQPMNSILLQAFNNNYNSTKSIRTETTQHKCK